MDAVTSRVGTFGVLVMFAVVSIVMSEAITLAIHLVRPLPSVTFVLSFVIPALVAPAVAWFSVRMFQSMAYLYEANRDLVTDYRALALHDQLTGVVNRRGLFSHIRTLPPEQPLTIGLADLDHFKAINDAHGHEIGDSTLLAVTSSLKELADGTALVARTGGDEFVIVLDGGGHEGLPERLRVPVQSGLDVSVSLGWATGAAADIDHILRVADDAMYEHKHPRTASTPEAGRDDAAGRDEDRPDGAGLPAAGRAAANGAGAEAREPGAPVVPRPALPGADHESVV